MGSSFAVYLIISRPQSAFARWSGRWGRKCKGWPCTCRTGCDDTPRSSLLLSDTPSHSRLLRLRVSATVMNYAYTICSSYTGNLISTGDIRNQAISQLVVSSLSLSCGNIL
ncbi:hypothetical protein KL918_005414, partial [Ogataea parapolymorpha]